MYFSRGCKSLMHGVVAEALASRKLVVGDDSSEGSETAKSGTDETETVYEAYLSWVSNHIIVTPKR